MWVVVAVILFVVLLHVFFPKNYVSLRDYLHIRKIPSFPAIPYFGCVSLFLVPNEDFLPKLTEIIDAYKPIVNIDVLGYNHVMLSEVEDLMVIFNSRDHIEKSLDYVHLEPWLGTGLLTSSGQKWFHHRKLLTPAFHFKILGQYINILNKNAKILVEKLRTEANNEFLEINPLILLCALDVICETAMGTSVNAQIGGEKEYVKATIRMSQIFLERQFTPWYYRPFLFNMFPIGWEQKRLLKILHGFTEKVIRERRETYRKEKMNRKDDDEDANLYLGEKEKISFLDLLIKISETENSLTETEIREEVDTFMFEGHDTTAAAMSWTLFELGHHPEIQERAYLEQCEIFQGSSRDATSADLQNMKYLDRVIKEALRLYPSVPVIARKLEKDITIRGYTLPKGTNVPAFIYYIHRDPKNFPDPLKFDPDRFLTDQIQKRHPYAYIPFSAGSRNCIGQKFAEMEEKVILSSIIRNFEFKSLDNREDVKVMGELILRPKNNLRMVFKLREQTAQ
ncbi:UNVERIFIED_CONTAM: hypothetical protein PYX00_009473 [Menopon gallinae]|uniref:Cytochrome P450 n=1 Tax=Menopon gallinae TaxID=328185 RepID=A0AAW2HBY9_9NEOP